MRKKIKRKNIINDETKYNLIKLYTDGCSYKEISSKLNINQGSICNIIRKLNVPTRKKETLSFPKPNVNPNLVGAFGKGFWDDNLVMKC